MFNEKIVKQINHKLWGKDIKILNYNEFNVFNVELYKENMQFIFDDVNEIKNCSSEDIKELEEKLNLLFEELSKMIGVDKSCLKIHSSTPIDPINPALFFTNCYFTPAKLERVFTNGMTRDSYFELKNEMSENEFLDKYSTLRRVSQPVLRTDEEAEKYILNSKIYHDYKESIIDEEDDSRIKKLNDFKKLIKETAKKDLEMIDISDKYIEGYSFKYCNGLYTTCYIEQI